MRLASIIAMFNARKVSFFYLIHSTAEQKIEFDCSGFFPFVLIKQHAQSRMFLIAIDSNPICVVAISKWGCILRLCTKVNDLIGHLAMNLFDVEDICL